MAGRVLRGPCGEKLGEAFSVPAEEARLANGRVLEGVTIRWLISRRDGAPSYAMRLFEMEPGSVIPGHRHPWEHEIYVLRGSMVLCVEERCYSLREGWFAYIPPNASHSYRAGEEGAAFLCIIPHGASVPEDWAPPCRRDG